MKILSEEKSDIESTEINSASLLETVSDAEVNSRISFEEFTDEATLISHDAFGKKQMKIKVLEVSDEHAPLKWKLGGQQVAQQLNDSRIVLDDQHPVHGFRITWRVDTTVCYSGISTLPRGVRSGALVPLLARRNDALEVSAGVTVVRVMAKCQQE